MKKTLFSLLLVLMFALMACQADNDNDNGANDNGDPNVENTGYDDRADNMGTDNNRKRDLDNRDRRDNNKYDLAEKAADKIVQRIDAIDRAYVLKTDENAYVAAGLDREDANDNYMEPNDVDINNGNTDINGNNNMNATNNDDNDRDNGAILTDKVKSDITEIVKSVDRDINNVYVSTNPDFFDLADNYANDMDNGEPVEGFFDQIGNTIERIFPQNKR